MSDWPYLIIIGLACLAVGIGMTAGGVGLVLFGGGAIALDGFIEWRTKG